MSPNGIIIHYDEIGLKGRNQSVFRDRLMDNILLKTNNIDQLSLYTLRKSYSRFLVDINNLTAHDEEVWARILSTTFGISSFSVSYLIPADLEQIKSTVVKILSSRNFQTFRISTERANKQFPWSSMAVDRQVGQLVVDELKKKVDLKNYDVEVIIEIVNDQAIIYLEKKFGPGGLPIDKNLKTIALISGGIDSPVAAWYVNKRGVDTIFLHFHSYPFTSSFSIDKVKKLVEKLNYYRGGSRLFLCPFGELQKQIVFKALSPSDNIDKRLTAVNKLMFNSVNYC